MSILYQGNTSVKLIATPAWDLSSSGLDTVTVKMQGDPASVATYMGALTQWQAYGDDANMFLSIWSNDEHPRKPTITLKYIGKRNGTLPQTQHAKDQQPSAVKQDVVAPVFDLEYLSPLNTTIDLARTDAAFSPAIFADTSKIQVTFIEGNNGRIVVIPGLNPGNWWLNFFFVVQITVEKSSELVPGQYYRNENTTFIKLFPLVVG